jgi:hypothetical protein
MASMSAIRGILGGALVAGLALAPATGAAQSKKPVVRYVANAINPGGVPGPSGMRVVEIVIERWSTESERDRLLNVLMEKGADKLLDALQGSPAVGYIRTPDSIRYDLRYARKEPADDGGEQIAIATDRYIGFWEARNQPRSINYPFTVIEIHMPAEGKGEGKMSIATKIIADKRKNQIVLEDYGRAPIMLTEVTKEDTSKN